MDQELIKTLIGSGALGVLAYVVYWGINRGIPDAIKFHTSVLFEQRADMLRLLSEQRVDLLAKLGEQRSDQLRTQAEQRIDFIKVLEGQRVVTINTLNQQREDFRKMSEEALAQFVTASERQLLHCEKHLGLVAEEEGN